MRKLMLCIKALLSGAITALVVIVNTIAGLIMYDFHIRPTVIDYLIGRSPIYRPDAPFTINHRDDVKIKI